MDGFPGEVREYFTSAVNRDYLGPMEAVWASSQVPRPLNGLAAALFVQVAQVDHGRRSRLHKVVVSAHQNMSSLCTTGNEVIWCVHVFILCGCCWPYKVGVAPGPPPATCELSNVVNGARMVAWNAVADAVLTARVADSHRVLTGFQWLFSAPAWAGAAGSIPEKEWSKFNRRLLHAGNHVVLPKNTAFTWCVHYVCMHASMYVCVNV